ncbi:MAG: threonine--tRNA ligase, partial [candidate division WOR-3 bacterium]|nr:threonine--tRNA ligase [candidate division WOR-3 bacterium]
MIKITIDDRVISVNPGITVAEVLSDNLALAAKVNGQLVDLSFVLTEDAEICPIYFNSEEGKSIFWHSSSHLMAHAVKLLYPNVKLAIGPAIAEGFYYDFDLEQPLTEKDLEKIEAKMAELVKN